MLCGVKTGRRRRRDRDAGDTPRESVDFNRSQRTLCGNQQPSHSNSPSLDMAQIPATPATIIPRQHSANRRFRLFSLGHFISLFSAPFLTVVSGNRKPAAEILRVRGIKGATEESQLEETMKKSTEKGSAPKTYSVSLADYQLLEVVGEGASATVYRAMYIPYNEIVAVKCVDLDRCNSNLDDIRREAQTMSLAHHPNVVKGYCSFVVEHYLWFVMPYMAEGSCFHLMKVAYPDGFEEQVIGSILKETLKALEYFHKHGHIHRDVKAGNILLDSSGVVKLSDFGVTACMFDKGDRQHSRNTFVGTPCWMAPEVMQPGGGYDFKADIWSFGITALELAHGHAPFSKYPPMKVLLMTLQNAPPGLDYDRDKKFSKSFKEMVAMCLVKDQTKRPTAEKLLKHAFFKNVKPPEFSLKNLLADLQPLWERVKALQLKDAEQLALKKMPSSEQEALSQTEYKRGVSAWNFDINDLKIQASLILDDEGIAGTEEDGGSLMNFINNKILNDEDVAKTEKDFGNIRNSIHNKESPISRFTLEKPLVADENSDRLIIEDDGSDLVKKNEYNETDLQGVRSQVDIYRYDEVRLNNDTDTSTPVLDDEHRWENQAVKKPQMLSSPPPSSMPNNSFQRGFTFKSDNDEIQLPTERFKCDTRKASNLSGPLMLPNCASANSLSAPTQFSRGFEDYPEDMCKSNFVQIKGRFSVKSVDIAKPANQLPKENLNISLPASILVPHLKNIFRQTSFQQDLLMNLLKSMQENDIVSAFQTEISSNAFNLENDILVKAAVTEREFLLLLKISELQARINSLTDELTAARLKQTQLEKELNAGNFYVKKNGESI